MIWVDAVTIEQISNALRQLGPLKPTVGKGSPSDANVAKEYAALKIEYASKAKKSVFLQCGMNLLFTSGKRSIQHQVLTSCGGKMSSLTAEYRGHK